MVQVLSGEVEVQRAIYTGERRATTLSLRSKVGGEMHGGGRWCKVCAGGRHAMRQVQEAW